MSKDEFIIHEWQKDKMDALVKHNELEGAKKTGRDEGFEEGKSIGFASYYSQPRVDNESIY